MSKVILEVEGGLIKPLYHHEHYIKESCKLVDRVFVDSIYFGEGSGWFFTISRKIDPQIIAKQLNGLLGTNFEVEND